MPPMSNEGLPSPLVPHPADTSPAQPILRDEADSPPDAVPAAISDPGVSQTVVGDRNIITGKGNVIIYQLPPAEAEDRRDLLVLLQKVRSFWVKPLLEDSVHHAALLSLSKKTMPEVIEHPLAGEVALPHQTRHPLPAEMRISEIFDETGRLLLILGEPGSGKTTTLLELARDLLARAEEDPTQPVPVVFSLSAWMQKRQALGEWLTAELATKYHIAKKLGRRWLEQRRLLPLLDGLDEVKEEHRATCIHAIHAFAEQFGVPGLVITSRTREYEALPVRLRMGGAICLQPLILEQVDSYLASGGRRLAALRAAVREDAELQELARTPLMLNVMRLAYEGATAEVVEGEAQRGMEERRKHIFAAYVERMFARKGKAEQPYTKEQVKGWLSWLAQRMTEHGQTVFLIEQLQPRWLPTRWYRWMYTMLWRVLGVLIFWGALSISLSPVDEHLFASLLAALILALLSAAIDAVTREHSISEAREGRHRWIPWLVFGSSMLLLLLPMFFFVEGGMHIMPSLGLVYLAVILSLTPLRNDASYANDIRAVEVLRWSGAAALEQVKRALVAGVYLTLFIALVSWLEGEFLGLLPTVAAGSFGGVLWLLYGLTFGALISGALEVRTAPNEGIRRSGRSSLVTGAGIGLVAGLASWALRLVNPQLEFGVFWRPALMMGTAAALWYGGLAVLQHYTLRLLLYCTRQLPMNVTEFLNYATKLVLLQKVGGSYRFMHGLLQEHFAAQSVGTERR
jgi:DNA polymerase III delta prime subunit